jgi:hypothetical protein
MTRSARTLIFLVAATLANMLVIALTTLILIVAYSLTFGRFLALKSSAPVILGAFLAALVISTFVYKKALDWARKRWHLEEKLGFGVKERKH